MPVEIPVMPDGDRTATINVGPERFTFRTYFTIGQDRHWLLDITDSQSRKLISGINLVPGVDNLLKGMGEVMEGYQLYLLPCRKTSSGTKAEDDSRFMRTRSAVHAAEQSAQEAQEWYKSMDAPGNTMVLLWFNPGELNPFIPLDPMETIGTDLW